MIDLPNHRAHIRRVRSIRIAAASIAVALCASALTSTPASANFFEYPNNDDLNRWTVPAGVDVIQIELQGAEGGDGYTTGAGTAGKGGAGAFIQASISVSAGEVLEIGLGQPGANGGDGATNVGGASANVRGIGNRGIGPGGAGGGGRDLGTALAAAKYGGGGGGASAVRLFRMAPLVSEILVIAAGGGGGGAAVPTGTVASPTGGNGADGTSGNVTHNLDTIYIFGRNGSDGSDPNVGGGRGGLSGDSDNPGAVDSTSGRGGERNGGNAAAFNPAADALNGGGGLGGTNNCSGGGGGAGYFGGGGGGANADAVNWGCGGGGSGSSFREGTRGSGYRLKSLSAVRTGEDSDSPAPAFGSINYIGFNTTTLATGQAGSPYGQQIEALFGGDATPNIWAVTPALPSGLTLNSSTGEITGTPTAAAAGNYTITASYNPGNLGLIARSSTTFALTINADPSPPAPPSPNSGGSGGGTSTPTTTEQSGPDLQRVQSQWSVVAGDAVAFAPASNSGGASTYTVTPSLPPGLSLNPATGVISGVPTTPSSATTYVLRATNAQGTSSVQFTLQVSAKGPSAQPTTDRSIGFVRFKRGSAAVTPAMRSKVLRMTNTPTRKSSTFELVATVPKSPSAAARTLAHRRGVAIRRLLRSQGMKVESKITLREATQANDSRRVEVHVQSSS